MDRSALVQRGITPERLDVYMAQARKLLGGEVVREDVTPLKVQYELAKAQRMHDACVTYEHALEACYGESATTREVAQMKMLQAGRIAALCDLQKIVPILNQIDLAF